ncbi:membrane protein [Clostridium bornimense]|uniref:Membrane protein n=1 Tax=Clostridium bornimense TaxID=1216932 RepID=W6S129_9CLOT|nr:hypothetical protein [Clostridium bornimense]CDM67992.1 membrane protein [Clostridium bornimense]
MKNKRSLFLYMLVNPIFIIVYWISWYEFVPVYQYGFLRTNIKILLLSGVFFIIWLIWFIVRRVEKNLWEKYRGFYKQWICIALILIMAITLKYGYEVYKITINSKGYFVDKYNEYKNTKEIVYENENKIYKDGLKGIINNISKEVELPKKLYISNLNLTFEEDGTITSFSAGIYGKDKKGKKKEYGISYYSDSTSKITIHSYSYGNTNEDDDYTVEQLNKCLNIIPLESDIESWWEGEEYGIIYKGKRNWGYEKEGILYIDFNGNIRGASKVLSEIKGKTISVYVPDKEEKITPKRYNFVKDLNNIESEDYVGIPSESEKNDENVLKVGETIFLEDGTVIYRFNEDIKYKLEVTSSSLGSRTYALYKLNKEDSSWVEINWIAFGMSMGQVSSITFINEDLGFVVLAYGSGNDAKVFRTEDGGKTYTQIKMKLVDARGMRFNVNPYDSTEKVYEKDGLLYLEVRQENDGYYAKSSEGLYISKDHGENWEFEKELDGEE